MKYLLLFAFALRVEAADLSLVWHPSTASGVTNYVLYAGTNGLYSTNLVGSAVARVDCGTNCFITLQDIKPATWSFAVTAQTAPGVESSTSNILPVQIADAPNGLMTLQVQYSATLTNFESIGFFRLKLEKP